MCGLSCLGSRMKTSVWCPGIGRCSISCPPLTPAARLWSGTSGRMSPSSKSVTTATEWVEKRLHLHLSYNVPHGRLHSGTDSWDKWFYSRSYAQVIWELVLLEMEHQGTSFSSFLNEMGKQGLLLFLKFMHSFIQFHLWEASQLSS